MDALQRKSNPQSSLTNFIEAAQEVGHCHYECQTSWGNLGWLYGSVGDDIKTSIEIHTKGWTSSFVSPDPPAFLGSTPSVGLETIVQQRRWATGATEVLFSKQSPLIGFRRKIKFRQRLAYFWILMCIRSTPELIYCLLPAYFLLHNSTLFPKGPCLGIIVTLVGMHCLNSLWQFIKLGFSVQSWYVSQSLWRIIATSSWLFSIQDIVLKLFGISKVGFVIAKKTMPDSKSVDESKTSQGEDDGPISDLGKFEFDSSCLFIPGTFIMLVNLAALAEFLVRLLQSSCSHGGDGSGFAEACGCIMVVMLFFPFLKGLFEHGKYGIPLSTLCKAAFLTVLFVVFSVAKYCGGDMVCLLCN
ncbi:PREDICTED: cellulose synthase-like protein B5 [Camelina sativa]|uniref:Cellulose synthase-like protein B5 n=1 Tax=Camelina sativa TaxID=90675 RepID=A0ABM1QKZ1_CAMSA|nr:PREDICTED: cellulose synthase-like protein B5 [Camelina sativa]